MTQFPLTINFLKQPSSRLQVANYLSCVPVRKAVMSWLQEALQEVLESYTLSGSGSSEELSLQHNCARVWHLTEVLLFMCIINAHPHHSVLFVCMV